MEHHTLCVVFRSLKPSKKEENCMGRNEPCFCGSGRKHKKCHPDIHPSSRAAHIVRIYQEVDNEIQEYQQQHGYTPPCQKGCSACCYDQFNVSQVEFELLIHEMQSWPQKEVEEVFDRALDCFETVKKEYPEFYKVLEEHGEDNWDINVQQESLMKQRPQNSFPCPFLDLETGSCRVYNIRPFVCRTHGAAHLEILWEKASQDVTVCNKIPSGIKHKKVTPDASDLWVKKEHTTNAYDPYYDTTVRIREYPIFYFFKILYEKTGGKKEARYIHDRKNFSVSIEQDNREYVRSAVAKQRFMERMYGSGR
jgi:Fe-S-cluster containining protein